MPSRGLPRCSPAATQATILTGDTSEAGSDPLPLKAYEGDCAMTKDNHDLSSGGAGGQVAGQVAAKHVKKFLKVSEGFRRFPKVPESFRRSNSRVSDYAV